MDLCHGMEQGPSSLCWGPCLRPPLYILVPSASPLPGVEIGPSSLIHSFDLCSFIHSTYSVSTFEVPGIVVDIRSTTMNQTDEHSSLWVLHPIGRVFGGEFSLNISRATVSYMMQRVKWCGRPWGLSEKRIVIFSGSG